MKKLIQLRNCYFVFCIALPSLAQADCNHLSGNMSAQAIAERIKPVAVLAVEGGEAKKAAASEAAQPLSADAGKTRYEATCKLCHDVGLAGAPKFRNKTDWKPRMEAGMEEMLKIAIQGKGAMPPKGTCMQCSDEELRKTIEYMLPQ